LRDKAVRAGVDLGRLPRHIAIIMDGNGRWAQERGLDRVEGHYEGANATKRAVKACHELGVGVLTVYSFSTENWKRPPEEVAALMALMEWRLAQEIDELVETNVVFRVSGRLHELPESFQEEIRRAMERTKDNTGLIFNPAINYGGRAEIVDAARALAARCARGEIAPEDIDERLFAQHLYAPDLPDPDLLIRTGGEMRISNFLTWETAYTEFVVLPVLWPDFDVEHLLEAILQYQRRERRFGGLSAGAGEQ
jgi:undecaprenyl diphosphate synthase